MIFFQINAVPVAQPRQRHAVKHNRHGQSFVRNYVPGDHEIHAWKLQLQILARQAYQGDPLNKVPVSLSVKFLMPRPKSLKGSERAWHLTTPDTDNLVKAVKDALTGICWVDDAIVCREMSSKEYAAPDESPGATVMIEVIQ